MDQYDVLLDPYLWGCALLGVAAALATYWVWPRYRVRRIRREIRRLGPATGYREPSVVVRAADGTRVSARLHRTRDAAAVSALRSRDARRVHGDPGDWDTTSYADDLESRLRQ